MGNLEFSYKGKKICNVMRVVNIQQEDQFMSGVNKNSFSNAKELFSIYTDDRKFIKLYRYDETDNIISDLLKRGYITYDLYFGDEEIRTNSGSARIERSQLLKEEIKKVLLDIFLAGFDGVCYKREGLVWYQEDICVVHGGVMRRKGINIPAFQYRESDNHRFYKIDKCIGNKSQFKNELSEFIVGFPLSQLIFAYYLSGAIRQILVHSNDGVGEYGLVTCITGESGSGKTTTTTTFQNILFGKGGMVSNNITSYGLYKILEYSGICPVVRDDSSTDTHSGISHIKEKVLDIYNIASGKSRITGNSEEDMIIFAPFLESREENWGLSDMIKHIRQVEGYKYRVLEIHCQKGDLTKDSESARKLSSLSGKYSGMAILFLDYLVDYYTEKDIITIYKQCVKEMDSLLVENDLESRYANRTAVILTAAKICEEAYEMEFDMESIKNIIIESIRAFERRLEATPDNFELKILYNRFKEKDNNGIGVNDNYIVDSVANYSHKLHYVAFLKRKPDEFYIPQALMGLFISEEPLIEPRFWGFDSNRIKTDLGVINGEHWNAVLKEWGDQGILIKGKNRSPYTKTVKLNGIPTTCYQFSWKKIAQQFGDNSVLDMTRFSHDTDEEICRTQDELKNF